jgi:hypothetical protein
MDAGRHGRAHPESRVPLLNRLLRVTTPPGSQQIDLNQKKTKRQEVSGPEYHVVLVGSTCVFLSMPSAKAFKNREFIVVLLKMPVVASRLSCNEEFISKATLWNTYPLEILD